jgi:uncharacterized repeat protein (TIGR03803 family)
MKLNRWKYACAVCVVWAAAATAAQAQIFEVLYTFTGLADGAYPYSGLLLDSAGKLYSAAGEGGLVTGYCYGGCGTVFEVNTKTGKETTLFEFNGADGSEPFVQNLWRDRSGNLYGTTIFGGDLGCGSGGYIGCGTAFELAPDGKETVLYKFADGADGGFPYSGLALDATGNLYGTTSQGGDAACSIGSGLCATVFKLSGHGTEKALYSFTDGTDGAIPLTGLVLDSSGNAYGTTQYGGDTSCGPPNGCGVVFRVDRTGKETALHAFTGGNDGALPSSGLIGDVNGNLYGTTRSGGAYNYGTLFKIEKSGAESVLYSFTGEADGAGPAGNLLLDAEGNIYGTATGGGSGGAGTVFKLDKSGNETVLHTFTGLADGAYPESGLVVDSNGILYGTAPFGGDPNGTDFGTIFLIKP